MVSHPTSDQNSENLRRPVIVITGASSGLGAAMAKRYSRWATVYGTTRTDVTLEHCNTLQMEVTNQTSVDEAIEQVYEAEGRIDVLINNAGVVLSGASETTPIEDAIRQFDINFFGAMRVTQAVLPGMRRLETGVIVNVGSMAGSVPMPYRGCYSASKAALENWAWALRLELRRFGIGVCCIQAGDCRTDLSVHGSSEFGRVAPHCSSQDTYKDFNDKVQAKYRLDEEHGRTPDQMAKDIERVVKISPRRLRFRYTTGPLGQRVPFVMRRCITDRMIEAVMIRTYMS